MLCHSKEKEELSGQVQALEAAVAQSQNMLQQAAEGGEAAVTSLSQDLEQVKSHKAALVLQVQELEALNDATRVQLLQAQGLAHDAQVCNVARWLVCLCVPCLYACWAQQLHGNVLVVPTRVVSALPDDESSLMACKNKMRGRC